MRWAVPVALGLAALLAPRSALAVDVKQPPADKTDIPVGEKAPKFTLKDQDGKERTLDEFLKKGTVAVVFTRSAGW
jgi:cytochrome oxidase Cu insertion factor (SCO1/SenC/PrrC family)